MQLGESLEKGYPGLCCRHVPSGRLRMSVLLMGLTDLSSLNLATLALTSFLFHNHLKFFNGELATLIPHTSCDRITIVGGTQIG